MRNLVQLVLAGVLAFVSVSCRDVGGVFVVDNRSNQNLVVRLSGTMQDPGASKIAYVTRHDVLSVPAHARLAVAVLPFAPQFRIEKVEILTDACAVLASFAEGAATSFARDGNVVVVEGDLSARLVHEFPEDGLRAAPADQCAASATSRLT